MILLLLIVAGCVVLAYLGTVGFCYLLLAPCVEVSRSACVTEREEG